MLHSLPCKSGFQFLCGFMVVRLLNPQHIRSSWHKGRLNGSCSEDLLMGVVLQVLGFACAFHSMPTSLQCSHRAGYSCCSLDRWNYARFDRPTTGMGPCWTLGSIHVYQAPQSTGKHLPKPWTKGFRQSNTSMDIKTRMEEKI